MNKLKGLSDRIRLEMEIKDLISAATDAAYREGYEAGKLVGAIDSVERINDKWLEEREVKSANQQRAELIFKAKEFVKSSIQNNYSFGVAAFEFEVNPEKRTIVALYRGVNTRMVYKRGIAKCNPSDVFNEHIGKAIALARALQIDIPVEFLEAVQPDELVVGHVTIWSNNFDTTYTVNKIVENKAYCNNTNEFWRLPLTKGCFCTIIDDSDAQYEVTL